MAYQKPLRSYDGAGTKRNIAKFDGSTFTFGDENPTTKYLGATITVDSGTSITLDAATDITIDAAGNDVFFKDNGTTSVWINTNKGAITASGDVSSSFASTASFGSMILSNLPTTRPTISGSLWCSGSAGEGSKYLVVFTGI